MGSERVTILDSYPFQNSVRMRWQMDADPITLTTYQWTQSAAELAPALIYLDPGDAAQMIRAIAEQRGRAWSDYAMAVVTPCPYASARDLQEMDGRVAILRSYKHLLDASVARYPLPKLVLSACHRHWADCHAQIQEFLGLQSAGSPGP